MTTLTITVTRNGKGGTIQGEYNCGRRLWDVGPWPLNSVGIEEARRICEAARKNGVTVNDKALSRLTVEGRDA